MSADLRLEGVSLTYRTRRGALDALGPIDLTLAQGEFVAVLGPSGCGKSTLAKLAAGLIAPTAGTLRLGDAPISGPSRRTGVVFQKPNLLPWRSVRQNVLLPAATLGLAPAPAQARAAQLLELVGLAGYADNYPHELSGGMQQRVGIARMLLADPELLLMDEPFAALDALTREALTLELQRIWSQQRKSVLFITHSIPEAVFLADRILVLSPRPGRIVEDYRPALPRPRDPDTLGLPEFNAACHHLRRHFTHA
ncbi:ABC transporter [Bordetella genomosp. 1]|uniref:ABC transporter n=1 Tax=Bordetella genomosp. 1 TaxID=1395607 RepID=A0A261SDD4_9BORD|nr:ABC transporter ATP-binding protein [Bordetella genomosp. 1]MDQ8032179.1 ABC transporter ATP-binding protein [Bordetella sp.]OZI35366.1 ABC transporter [Bordetella genomosp. 1]OZI63911.1 ABC transporter [Bordetella genomosp. 1]